MKSALLAAIVVAALVTAGGHAETPESSGTIAGRILNSDGSPAVAIGVGILSASSGNCGQGGYGLPTGNGMYSALFAVVQTDASGRYAFENVPPGQYHLAAGALVPRGQLVPPCYAQGRYRGLMTRPVYLPGVQNRREATLVSTDSRNTPIEDLRLPSAPSSVTDGFKVSGQVIAARRAPRQGLFVVQLSEPENPTLDATPCATFLANVGPDGAFEFRSVPPCVYVATVLIDYGSAVRPAFPGIDSSQRVTVGDRNVIGLRFE